MEEDKNKRKQDDLTSSAVSGASYKTIQTFDEATKQHYVAYPGVDNETGRTLVKGLRYC